MKLIRGNLFRTVISLSLFFFSAWVCYGQRNYSLSPNGLTSYFIKVYKLDQNLINGVKYYNPHSDAVGDPFFTSDKSEKGRIVVNGTTYNDVLLRYDICNQQVILEYNYTHGGINQVILNNEFISEFEIFNKLFRKFNFPLTGEKFFQVIPSDSIAFLLSWKKDMIPGGSFSQSAYEYTREKKKTYLMLHDNLWLIKGNKSLTRALSNHAPEIRKYMNQNKVKLRNSTDEVLADLVKFCSNIYFNSNSNSQK